MPPKLRWVLLDLFLSSFPPRLPPPLPAPLISSLSSFLFHDQEKMRIATAKWILHPLPLSVGLWYRLC